MLPPLGAQHLLVEMLDDCQCGGFGGPRVPDGEGDAAPPGQFLDNLGFLSGCQPDALPLLPKFQVRLDLRDARRSRRKEIP